MSRSVVMLIGVVAFVLSGSITYLGYMILTQNVQSSEAEIVNVVVAADRIHVGTRLERSHLRVKPWASSDLIQGSFSSVEDLLGRGVLWPVEENEPFLEAKLAPKGAGAGLTSVIPDGMRALSVKVNDVIGVAGFVVPGSRVDVILTGSSDGNRATDTSKIILENVEVLAAGQNIERDAQGKPQSVQVVTLTVTPEQAQKLALASQDGRIQLALRNPLDLDHSNPDPTYRAALYNESSSHSEPSEPSVRKKTLLRSAPRPQPPKPKEVKPKVLNVEVIAGQERKVLTFMEKGSESR